MTAGAALAVFGQHYDGLVRFLRQRTGCADAAHELAHETWLRLVVRADAGSAQGGPSATAQPMLAGKHWPEEAGAAAQRLARYHHAPIRVAPEAAALPVLGRVRIALAYEWLRLLPQSLPVRVQRASDGSIDILPARRG